MCFKYGLDTLKIYIKYAGEMILQYATDMLEIYLLFQNNRGSSLHRLIMFSDI